MFFSDYQRMMHRHEVAVAAASEIDASATELVTVADLQIGDVITELGNVTFPFPFTLSAVTAYGKYGTTLTATHGWFTPGPEPLTTRVVRVLQPL